MPEILDIYFKEIANNEPLTREKEKDLIKVIRNGDEKTRRIAVDKIIKANLRFVASVARNYQNQGMDLEDIISAGNQGLLKSIDFFDEKKDIKFISYAVWWIRQNILLNMATHSRPVRIPLHSVSAINEVRRAYNKLEQKCFGYVTAKDIALAINKSEKFVAKIIRMDTPAISLNTKLYEDVELLDTLSSEEENKEETFQLKKRIASLIETLKKDRDREVIKMYFGINYDSTHTLEEIGQKFHLSRERVRQIKARALGNLKRACGKKIKPSKS